MKQVKKGRRPFPKFDHGEPIRKLDTMPVLIVSILLAIMMLLNTRVPQHALMIDFAFPVVPSGGELGFPTDLLAIAADGQLYWNSRPVSDRELVQILTERRSDARPRGLKFLPDPHASYERSLRILSVVKSLGHAGAGFCFAELARHRRFGKGGSETPSTGGPPDFICDPQMDGRLYPQVSNMPALVSPPAIPPPA